jgi:hypothetical protein
MPMRTYILPLDMAFCTMVDIGPAGGPRYVTFGPIYLGIFERFHFLNGGSLQNYKTYLLYLLIFRGRSYPQPLKSLLRVSNLIVHLIFFTWFCPRVRYVDKIRRH